MRAYGVLTVLLDVRYVVSVGEIALQDYRCQVGPFFDAEYLRNG